MGDVAEKLFAAVLAERLTCWAIANDRLSAAQRAFCRMKGISNTPSCCTVF